MSVTGFHNDHPPKRYESRGAMSESVLKFECGPRRDHECDTDGPTIYGGPDVIETTDIKKAGIGYTWGSVSCSKCGMTAMEKAMWDGH